MKRRTFLKGIAGSGLTLAASKMAGIPLISTAKAASQPVLVVIFQRGGCDGLNTIVPFADPDYQSLRPTIGIAEPSAVDPESALNLDDFFGMHPSMTGMKSIFDNGDMAVLPAVHYPNASRSHFTGQVLIESADPTTPVDSSNGWLNRRLADILPGQQLQTPLQAVHFGSTLPHSLIGSVPVQSFSFINSFNLGLSGAEENQLINDVLPLYQDMPANANAYQQLVHQYGQLLFNSLATVDEIDTSTYNPTNGAVYPETSYGRRLRETAQLIKADLGLEMVTIDLGGWDTHSNQGGGESSGRHAKRLAEFSDGINALYTDLGAEMDNVVILTMTEFGRTAEENGSNGTDHGHAGVWTVTGPQINSGIVGAWPGLAADDLVNGRYLQHSVDYRDILGDILNVHFGHSLADVSNLLPGHGYNALGLFAS